MTDTMQITMLSADDVRAAVDMPAAIRAVRDAFGALSSGGASVPVRLGLETEHGLTLLMPAHLKEDGSTGVKVATVTPANPGRGLPAVQALVLVVDPGSGRVPAIMDGTWLTALRTGAAGGVAADALARADASVVALFGAGVQARTQLDAVRCVRSVDEVRIVSRSGDSADRLVEELEGLAARRVDDPDSAISGADIVIAATNSSTPVFDGSRVEPGTHVTGVGSYTPEMREVDTELVTRARVFVDQREAALEEAGDIIGPIRDAAVDESVIEAEIGEVLLGRAPGRTSADQITFFKSVGNAAQDVAVAALVVEAARKRGLGLAVEL